MEIIVDYEKEKISFIIFAEMPWREQEKCVQIIWSGDHLLVLKEGFIVIDRKLKLKNRTIFQKSQYFVGENEGCLRGVSNVTSSNKGCFYGITADKMRIFSTEKETSNFSRSVQLCD